jgi:hypothetical protein
VYFVKGQENLAQRRLGQAPGLDEKQDLIFCSLRQPKTKKELHDLLLEYNGVSTADRLLQELVFAGLVGKVEFVTGHKGAKKFGASKLFGNLACKTYYYRLDCPKNMAQFVINNIDRSKINEDGFEYSLNYNLRRILSPDSYAYFVKNMHWWSNESNDKKEKKDSNLPRMDDYLQ